MKLIKTFREVKVYKVLIKLLLGGKSLWVDQKREGKK